jgi:hypothetical protein
VQNATFLEDGLKSVASEIGVTLGIFRRKLVPFMGAPDAGCGQCPPKPASVLDGL